MIQEKGVNYWRDIFKMRVELGDFGLRAQVVHSR